MSAIEVVDAEFEVDRNSATVQSFPNGWNLITYNTWQVSVSADGLVRLPHSVLPETVPDLVEALRVAAEVGAAVRADNEAREAEAARKPRVGIDSRGGLVVKAGAPPAGAMRLPVMPRPRKG